MAVVEAWRDRLSSVTPEDYRAQRWHGDEEVERRGGYFVVEGLLAVEALLDSPYPVRSVLATERQAEQVRSLVGGRVPVLVRREAEVAAVAGFDVHRGVLAAADRTLPGVGEVVAAARVVVVTEGLGDHENLGALFRNAAALGASAVLVDPTTADPLYRRSVRVSLGHVLGAVDPPGPAAGLAGRAAGGGLRGGGAHARTGRAHHRRLPRHRSPRCRRPPDRASV